MAYLPAGSARKNRLFCLNSALYRKHFRPFGPYVFRKYGRKPGPHPSILIRYSLENFSNECCKTKTKVITPANHNTHKLPNKPIRTRSKYIQPAPSAGKCVLVSRDWFESRKIGRERGASFLTNHRAN